MTAVRERYRLELTDGPGSCSSCLYRHVPVDDEPCHGCIGVGSPLVGSRWSSCREAVEQLDAEGKG